MKKNNVESILSEAVNSMTPNDFDAVLSACKPRGEVIQMNEYKTENTENKSSNKSGMVKKIVATAAAVALIIGCTAGFGFYQKANAVGTIVSVDAGSAVSLKVNNDDVVIDVAENEFGVEKADVKGMSVSDASCEVVKAMADAGDITNEDNIVLLTVEKLNEKVKKTVSDATSGAGEETGDADSELNFEIADAIKTALGDMGIDATVIDQQFDADEAIQKLSEELGITAGKTSFIDKILGTTEDGNTEMSDLATQSISAIIKYAADYLAKAGEGTDTGIDTDALKGEIGTAIKGALNEGINVGVDGKANVGVQTGDDGSISTNIDIEGKANVDFIGNADGNFALGVEVDGANYTFDTADPANSMVGLIESIIKTYG